MKTLFSTVALVAAMGLAGAASAQASGGPDAKGNAPLKAPHTVNNGAAKRGANSFTEGQARTHIEKAGFSGVTGLTKGQDGVWRGQAMRGGQATPVAMDFKGNVTTPGAAPGAEPMAGPGPMASSAPMAGPRPMADHATTTASATTHSTTMHHHHRRHHASCANPGANGAACSGVDKNDNGVSDREDRAQGH